ncbi:MAG: bifunctional phosphoribosylaminoimidazolecarboxamide formyltransferase/IMP cyclohydrolase, partial [Candidatus Omnitrophota bacterium]
GENPHQRASYYRNVSGRPLCVADAKQLQGKELSFNNIIDLGAAVDIVKNHKLPAVGIIKHNNPCGAAAAETIEKAYVDAIECDRLSAFGCIMGFNRPIDASLAGLILKEADFVECIIAPAYGDGAFEIFKAKKNLRVLEFPFFCTGPGGVKDVKMIPGGALVQDKDEKRISARDLKVVTRNKPSEEMIGSMLFGWDIVRQVKSNAIVLCRGTKTVGIGAGQMSRVDAVIIAIRKAGGRAEGSVLVSDAFFPKADSVEKAHEAGIAAIIQPGGSIKDGEVIDACDRFDIPMVFTGTRHFKH